ncbi:MAG: hypothetical protein ACRD8O_18535 [Bryobacteraceae bacterium]
MAVYKKTYYRYEGALTPLWSRFGVITRFALEDMNRSRFLTLFFLGTFIFPLLCAIAIYITHNLSALKLMDVDVNSVLKIDVRFFLVYLGVQSMLAFFLNAFIGPGLVSPDLTNGALPLYLARPFSRAEYVLGKFGVLFFLLSAMTWFPGLLLWSLQGYVEGNGWAGDNINIATGLFFGSMVWIIVLSLLSLAMSAWVKWKPAAAALLFGIFFIGAGFGAAVNEVMRTRWGNLLNIGFLMGSVWNSVFASSLREAGRGAVFFRVRPGQEIPLWCVWTALAVLCSICLYVLAKRIRGAEVVR